MPEDVLDQLSTVIGRKVEPVAPAAGQPRYSAVNGKVQGLKRPGNIDITKRPNVPNPQTGGNSSVWSTTFGTDEGEVLVPRVTNGEDGKPPRILSEKEAQDYYRKYKKYLGVFDSPSNATAYAQQLHEQQAAQQGR